MLYPESLPIQTIWDEIAYFLESSKDLLSLASTCRAFKELIIPDHLEYRYIHCDLRRRDVWQFLATRPRLGKGIRSIKFLDEPKDTARVLLPQVLTDMSPDRMLSFRTSSEQHINENLALFRNALIYMTSLKDFTWRHTSRGIPSPQELIATSRVLTDITHCLESLFVGFPLLLQTSNRQLLDQLSMWTLTGLKKVRIRHPGTAAIHMILDCCPDIEDLHLTGYQSDTISVYYIMQRAYWKKLRRVHFYLSNPTHFPSPDMDPPTIVTSFFDRHDTLKSIHFEVYGGSVPSQPASFLPRLRSIGSQIHGLGTTLLAYLSNDVISRLVHWHCPVESFDVDTLPQMDDLESACFTIYDFCSPTFFSFLSKAPNLKKICVGEGVEVLKPDLHEEFIDICLQYARHLTHIFCDYSLYDESEDADVAFQNKLNSSLQRLCALKGLTYFRIISNDGMTLVKIERDEEGMYESKHNVNLEEAGGDPHYWGDFISDF